MKSLGYHNSGFVLARKGRQPELSGWYIVRCSRRRQNTAPSLSNRRRRGAGAGAAQTPPPGYLTAAAVLQWYIATLPKLLTVFKNDSRWIQVTTRPGSAS